MKNLRWLPAFLFLGSVPIAPAAVFTVTHTADSASGNVVLGNFIGTDVTGTAALGNSDEGVLIEDSPDNTHRWAGRRGGQPYFRQQ